MTTEADHPFAEDYRLEKLDLGLIQQSSEGHRSEHVEFDVIQTEELT